MASSSDGVVYWLVGSRHDEHFVVSLLSLRDHWNGPVTVVVGDEHAKMLATNCVTQLGPLEIVDFDYAGLKSKHSGKTFYLAKCLLWRHVLYDRIVFFDADTLIVGDFRELFPERDEVRLTQFCNWTTAMRRIQKRIQSWQVECPEEVAWQLHHTVPAINTGVFGFSRATQKFMDRWLHVTEMKARTPFMADELSCQCIYPWYPHIVFDDRWNWSPKFSTEYLDVRVGHGHGWKFHKTDRGRAMWEPVYERAKSLDIAGIRSWTPTRKFRSFYGLAN